MIKQDAVVLAPSIVMSPVGFVSINLADGLRHTAAGLRRLTRLSPPSLCRIDAGTARASARIIAARRGRRRATHARRTRRAWLASGVARGAGMARVPLSEAQRRAAVLPSTLRLNAKYYIEKLALPALERVIGLAGADVRRW